MERVFEIRLASSRCGELLAVKVQGLRFDSCSGIQEKPETNVLGLVFKEPRKGSETGSYHMSYSLKSWYPPQLPVI